VEVGYLVRSRRVEADIEEQTSVHARGVPFKGWHSPNWISSYYSFARLSRFIIHRRYCYHHHHDCS